MEHLLSFSFLSIFPFPTPSARLAKKEDALAEAEEKKRLERIAMKKKQK